MGELLYSYSRDDCLFIEVIVLHLNFVLVVACCCSLVLLDFGAKDNGQTANRQDCLIFLHG
jgi:hypothetical protein